MNRVDHHRYPGCTSRRSPEPARFGVVEVDDVGPFSTEQPIQVTGEGQVAPRVHRPGSAADGYVADAGGFETGHVPPGSRHPHHFEPGPSERQQLWLQQQLQAHVHRGHMHQQRPTTRRCCSVTSLSVATHRRQGRPTITRHRTACLSTQPTVAWCTGSPTGPQPPVPKMIRANR